MLNEISFEAGSLETMMERLFKTMNSIDQQWSEKVEPASQKQIHAPEEIADLKQHGKSIPYAYLLFLEEMGQNDNGLLEQQWDGDTEVNIDSILRTCIHNLNTPSVRAFSRPAALKNLEIHNVFLRFFALRGEKIPRPSGIFGCEYRF